MTLSTAYNFGRAIGRLPLSVKLLLLIAVVGALWWFVTDPEHRASDEAAIGKKVEATALEEARAAKAKLKADCEAKRQNQLAEFQRILTAEPRQAADLIRPCASALGDAELLAAVKTAEVASHKRAINHPSASAREKIESIDAFTRVYPVEAKQFENLRARLDTQATKEEEQRARQAKQIELRSRKSEGVNVGMTQEEVTQSSWGRPESVNRTVSSFGTREQWVYGGGNYLYFEGDRLTSIQTGGRR